MFRRHSDIVYVDLSLDLRDPDDWKTGSLRSMDYPKNITTLAIEPISGIFGVGTASGTIFIFGAPGVETKLLLPDSVGVKFLQFAAATFQLVCIDDTNTLHIWDLGSYGRPKLVKSARFNHVNSLTLSPCHSHAFLALNSGEIKTYDLTCLRKSPYTMPNMWELYQDKLLTSGSPQVTGAESRISVETVIHPRDLNRLFVVYGGGVVLTDLSERVTIGAYELVLPPGAPGGFGYGANDLLTHRRPEVMTLAIHPAGHFFAVGYADGSLGFWATEDEEKPLLVRTLDELDVNTVDPRRLDEHVFNANEGRAKQPPEREPIFKLSWSGFSHTSDPRGGKTTLTILGGLYPGEAPGLTVIQLPAFNPQESSAPTSPDRELPALHPVMRQAMRNSLDPLESYFYITQGIIQDYLLIPRMSPHFSGTFDPIAILLLMEGEGDTRTTEAYQYPPPEFSGADAKSSNIPTRTEACDASDSVTSDLAETLKSLQDSGEPQRLMLPLTLSNGHSGVLGGTLLRLQRDTYKTLISGATGGEPVFPMKGGQAWADESKARDLKFAKYQPHRVLMTHHRDLTVHFSDVSAQLLITQRPTPLQNDFPDPLPHLTIHIEPILMDSVVNKHSSRAQVQPARVEDVYFVPEALETTVVLDSGEIILYRLSVPRNPTPYREPLDEEIIILDHVSSHRAFSPYFMLKPKRGPCKACAVSDLGFMAAAYHNTLYIVSMRGPQVLLRHVDGGHAKGRHVQLIPGHGEWDHICSLVWTVSPLAKDPEPQIRLVAMRASGQYQVYTITQTGSPAQPWRCNEPIIADGGTPNPITRGVFVVDSKSGVGVTANHVRLAAASTGGLKEPTILVTVGTKGARSFVNLNGERIGKAEWGLKIGTIQCVQIVEKLGSHVLVVTTERQDLLVYSLPQLEYLMTLRLPSVPYSSLSLDESGDFVSWIPHPSSDTIHQATYGTLFDIRRVYELPDIDFSNTKPVIPPTPQPVSAGPPSLLQLGSWFPFNQSKTGVQIDELLGGPDRPLPVLNQTRGNFLTGADIMAGASGVAATAAATQSNLYSRITSALNERGQVLNNLEERFNALGEGSKNMASQAKRIAAQQTAKSWFGL